MSQNQDTTLKRVQEKISILTSLFTLLKQQNEKILLENKELKEIIEQQNNTLKDLEKNNKNLQLAKAVSSSSGDTSEAKKNIEEIVREIDTCIALLNK